jgi:hypothetical protein
MASRRSDRPTAARLEVLAAMAQGVAVQVVQARALPALSFLAQLQGAACTNLLLLLPHQFYPKLYCQAHGCAATWVPPCHRHAACLLLLGKRIGMRTA